MKNYMLSKVRRGDIPKIVDIYNSNKSFLYNHLSLLSIKEDFIINEMEEMKKGGFNSTMIKNDYGDIIGICDFKIGKEVYLSLLMIHSRFKEKGIGKIIYKKLEDFFIYNGGERVRIDVVCDYEGNAMGFWEKQGFIPSNEIELEWNENKLKAIKMYK